MQSLLQANANAALLKPPMAYGYMAPPSPVPSPVDNSAYTPSPSTVWKSQSTPSLSHNSSLNDLQSFQYVSEGHSVSPRLNTPQGGQFVFPPSPGLDTPQPGFQSPYTPDFAFSPASYS